MNLDNILKSLTASKKGAIVIILIFVAIFITNNLNFFKSISINFSNEKKESIQKSEVNENNKIVRVSESSMRVSMTNFIYQNEHLNSPSYLSFTLNNTSWSDVNSIDKIIIKVIHGGNILYSTALPSDIIINNMNDTITEFTKIYFSQSSIIKIYLLLEKPTFERIEIQLFKYDTMKEIIYLQNDIINTGGHKKDVRWYNFTIFLLIVLGFIVLVIVFTGIYLLQKKLSG